MFGVPLLLPASSKSSPGDLSGPTARLARQLRQILVGANLGPLLLVLPLRQNGGHVCRNVWFRSATPDRKGAAPRRNLGIVGRPVKNPKRYLLDGRSQTERCRAETRRPRRGDALALTSGERARYAAAIIAMGVGTAFLLLVPYVLKSALDALSDGNASLLRTLIPAALAIVGFNAIHGLLTYLRGRWAAEASEGIVRRLDTSCILTWNGFRVRITIGQIPAILCSGVRATSRQCAFLAAQVVEIARVALFLAIATPIMLGQDCG